MTLPGPRFLSPVMTLLLGQGPISHDDLRGSKIRSPVMTLVLGQGPIFRDDFTWVNEPVSHDNLTFGSGSNFR